MTYSNNYSHRLDWAAIKNSPEVLLFADYLEGLGKEHRVMIIHDNDPDGHCAFHVLKYYLRERKALSFRAEM